MSDRLKSYISIMSMTRVIAVLAGLYLVNQLIIITIVSPLGHDMLGLQTTLSQETFRSILQSWERSGLMAVYLRHFYPDFPHPVIYSLLLSALLSRGIVMTGNGRGLRYLVLLPFAAGLLHIIENFIHLYLIADPARIGRGIVIFSGICTNAKWTLGFGCLIIALVMILRAYLKQRGADAAGGKA